MIWETVIGLEVHAQLKTHSKLFSGSSTRFGASPNTQASFIDTGLPGVLPVVNKEAIIMAIRFGLAVNATINNFSYFERKNYFYPDLPKGYQISQFQRPIVSNGSLTIDLKNNEAKTVHIERAHLEEDAGKSLHTNALDLTGIDLNRAGTPLLEIVTTPCLYSAHEVIEYLKNLQQLVRFLGICDGNMQEGSFRCDVNLSLKPEGSTPLGTRTELKNLNSFKFIEKAIFFEQERHQDLLERNQTITQETRSFCPDTETTHSLRSKENEQDYRYFPDPDLLPIEISETTIQQIKQNFPLLPAQIRENLRSNPSLNDEDILFLLAIPAHYYFFIETKQHSNANEKLIVNWLKGHYLAALSEKNLTFNSPPLSAKLLGELLTEVDKKTISTANAKKIFAILWEKGGNVHDIIATEGLEQVDNSDLIIQIIQQLIHAHPQQVNELKQGKEKLLAFFVGQVMKQTKGQANPEQINSLLKQELKLGN